MEEWFGRYRYNDEFFQFLSLSHVTMLIILLLSATFLFLKRDKIRESQSNKIRYILAIGLLVSELSLYLWYIYTDVWNLADSLPLQLCSISLLLSIVMLFSRSYFLFEITYFFGVGGALQAMLTPELTYDFPHYRYFHFFLAHIAIILASLYMVWVEKYKPTFKSVWKAMLVLNALAIFIYIVNKITGGNYMFLAKKPSNPSILDFLGPYPWYILSLEAVAFSIFLLLYLPFYRRKE
ncbi:TIGR02206 family membrane protein [Bacillus timonensis]|nr:TIGR02206 family membrane protein [Bacillus timonensis]